MNKSMINRLGDTLEGSLMQQNAHANVGQSERMISLGTGAFIALKGITNIFSHPWIAITELGVGGTLLYRGITGYCPIKERLDSQHMENKNTEVPVHTTMGNKAGKATESEISRENMNPDTPNPTIAP